MMLKPKIYQYLLSEMCSKSLLLPLLEELQELLGKTNPFSLCFLLFYSKELKVSEISASGLLFSAKRNSKHR